ncbi:hypothetical protein [Aureibacter tunicatorum]|uniref:Uncharacterized protein n=1 Tax=Aureibacter tunicatorum TaxID=866807 RepID=A0AAE3XIS8_9BACT|nr:hypothetical protein [Aureibacter tunicatorum]MDR6238506.1 hypothetical protein [Aureibacter tunicatorum]BDD05561.1 hypothetical protein AUTU_30440 [Aureibacter tunicatorum]
MYASQTPVQKKKTSFPSSIGSGGVIQRDVGFEVEVKNWRTWSPIDLKMLPVAVRRKNYGFRYPHESKEVLLKGDKYQLTADLPTDQSVPEFVTDPEPETPEGLKSTMDTFKRIENVVNILEREYRADGDKLPTVECLRQEGQVVREDAIFDTKGEVPDFHAQANVGLKISKIPDLLNRSGELPPSNSMNERLTRIKSVNTPPARLEMESMKNAHDKARLALDKFFGKHGDEMIFDQPSPELIGLVTLMVNYIECPMINFHTYTKGMFPVMARTDFASIYELLPDEEQQFFQQDDGLYFMRIFELVDFDPSFRCPHFMQEQFFTKGVRRENLHAPIQDLDHLSRELWIRNIPLGVDALTTKNYPGPDFQKEDLNTMGSWEGMFDKIGPQKQSVPIFELRRLQYTNNTEELGKIAHDVFLTIMALNNES